jgi:hypothetical protein
VVWFELLTPPNSVERVAIGSRVRDIRRLRAIYGRARWRKLKGIALVRLPDGGVFWAEVHWYEADGIGRREWKIKRLLDEHE